MIPAIITSEDDFDAVKNKLRQDIEDIYAKLGALDANVYDFIRNDVLIKTIPQAVDSDNTEDTDTHTRLHSMDGSSDHTSPSGTENNLVDFNSSGYPVDDSGITVTDAADAVTKKHVRLHDMDGASDHNSPSGTENNLVDFDAAGYPVDDSGIAVGDVIQRDGSVDFTAVQRCATSLYRRYYHLPLAAFDPGASGATWVDPDVNTLGGFQLDAAGEILFAKVDVHADWDAASDLNVELYFEVNIDNTGGLVTDTVDIKAVVYYKGVGELVNKSQVVEVATVVGQSDQYNLFKVELALNYDEVDNVIQAGDAITICMNLETDTSEVDNIIIVDAAFYYNTTHIGIESGDT